MLSTEHVWNVLIRERDLGKTYEGEYRLCLNNRTVLFVKKAESEPSLTFPVSDSQINILVFNNYLLHCLHLYISVKLSYTFVQHKLNNVSTLFQYSLHNIVLPAKALRFYTAGSYQTLWPQVKLL